MPETDNIHTTISVMNAVNDAVGADNDLADGWIVELGNHPTHIGKVGKALRAADKKLPKPECALRRVPRNVTNDIPEVRAG